ncbi:pyridoxamine 5'-phosphate oxidase family protein [Paenibacillus xylanexedens]|uniref:pyridoxamine 5'-phosphate oxidase family protein n=1 Tax=Paenibacillus xylanexedens TaxID=528191 RepID=UPI00119EDC9E|nr:pyridoxamine 5'-phosphate oxidase family protein [Paenibacillus xylanexedens]
MTSTITELNLKLMRWFDGQHLQDKKHEAMQLLTVSEDAWPHQAMISVGELVAISPTILRLALWSGTQTSKNMERTGKATLIAIVDHQLLTIRLALRTLPPIAESVHPRDRYEGEITSIRVDHAPYADITSGITYQLNDEPGTLKRWEETIAELRL